MPDSNGFRIEPQEAVAGEPYDRWKAPDGSTVARFYRLADGFLIRFPETADFLIDTATLDVRATIPEEARRDAAEALWHNAICPLIGNHRGELNLHGSAVVVDGTAIAFIAPSRRGKSTLAAAFARAGHPFLTEDVVALREAEDGAYMVQPGRPVLRLFGDSAGSLLDEAASGGEMQEKREFAAPPRLAYSSSPQKLGRIFLLGDGSNKMAAITDIAPPVFLSEILQHSFVLDVEDKNRMRGHFGRLADLADRVPAYTLDFPRDFGQLDAVVDTVVHHCRKELAVDDA